MTNSEIRVHHRERRRQLASAQIAMLNEQLNQTAEKNFTHGRGLTVAGYLPNQNGEPEPNLVPFFRTLQDRGARLAFPRLVENMANQMHMHFVDDLDAVLKSPPSKYGLNEPGLNQPVIAPKNFDFIFVPALAVQSTTAGFFRLGRGKGFYDRYLAGLNAASPGPRTIAVTYSFELIPFFDTHARDVACFSCLTESALLTIRG